ncbi:hypothetical protein [Sphingopyxis sp. GW247-27LB]|uniref:hypothetical protein n=1 Tax=Sphingopyxis sp. GW247-27LB TaxID=2012632 RepID=UPI000BA7A60C|nr:hypothetical protein [Sphingopyxis sp. GW247-27LB]PAL24528.1 hypothetical protein CD928_03780 [Sphingopyxis sp. GW247-27LB]
MAAVHLTHSKGIYRVRVEPPDAAPAIPLASETHVGHLSAQTAARIIATHLGLPVIDETQGGGA